MKIDLYFKGLGVGVRALPPPTLTPWIRLCHGENVLQKICDVHVHETLYTGHSLIPSKR